MILVTGGLGFIGLHTAQALLDSGEECVLTQYRVARQPAFIQGEIGKRAFVEQLDVTDGARLSEIGDKYPITGIVHLAVPALSGGTAAADLRVNMLGLTNILEHAERWKVDRISIASSGGVYRAVTDEAHTEDTWLPIESTNPTEAYKKAFEIVSSHFADRTGIDLLNLRISGIWGPLYHSMSNLPSRVVHAAVFSSPLRPGMRGPSYADDGGDMCYVKDCARGIALLQLADGLRYRTYNVAAGRPARNGEFVDAVKELIPEAAVSLPEGHDPGGSGIVGYSDISRIREDTGYEPAYDVRSGVADYVAWLRAGNAE
ncbi:MAG: NAD(P)-dependent oxidoreductase [Acidimicrobiaceae bacterium]|nr:NAD(P)-dependent oxidoreductase [Acidimicrobiaceae bacterium]